MNQKISRFESIQELEESVDKRIKDLNNKIDLQSKLIGDKIREGEKNNAEELSDLKEKLNPEKSKNKKGDDKKSKNNFGVDQLGGTIIYNNIDPDSKWKKIVFALNYNKTNNNNCNTKNNNINPTVTQTKLTHACIPRVRACMHASCMHTRTHNTHAHISTSKFRLNALALLCGLLEHCLLGAT